MGIRSNRLWGTIATAGLTAICASLIVPLPVAYAETSKVVSNGDCADVTVIAIGGSNTNDINNNPTDVPPRVTSMENKVSSYAAEAVRQALPDNKSIKFVEVKYKPVDEYIGFGGVGQVAPDIYNAAVMDGSKKFVAAAQKESSTCSNSSLVFIGFGQGAGVIRVSLEKLDNATQGQTKAVWLMSDAMHDGSGGDGFQYFDSYTGWDQTVNGFMRLSKAASDANSAAKKTGGEAKEVKLRDHLGAPIEHSIPASMKNNIVSMCSGKDGFCSPSEDVNIMIDSNPTQYLSKYFLSEGGRWVKERLDGNADYKVGDARGKIGDGTVVDRGDGATWVAENPKVPALFTKCISDYVVIGVRGSGEDIEGGVETSTLSTYGGIGVTKETKGGLPSQEGAIRMQDFSDELATASWGIKQHLPESATIRFVPITYEAQAATPQNFAHAPDLYLSSINHGKDQTKDMVKKVAELCPTAQIVLMGYSQGAIAVHEAVTELDRQYRDQIAAVYLIADPMRNQNDPAAQFAYDENSGDGFAQTGNSALYAHGSLLNLTGLPMSLFDADMTTKVLQICHTKDIFCSPSGSSSFDVHGNAYKQDSQFWGFPPEWAASKLVTGRIRASLPKSVVGDVPFLQTTNNGYEFASFFLPTSDQTSLP